MSDREELAVAEALQQLRGDRGFIDRVATPIFSHIKGRLPPWPSFNSYDPRERPANNQDNLGPYNGKEMYNQSQTTLPPLSAISHIGANGVLLSPSPPAADLAHTVLSPPEQASPVPIPVSLPAPMPMQMHGPPPPMPMPGPPPGYHQIPGAPIPASMQPVYVPPVKSEPASASIGGPTAPPLPSAASILSAQLPPPPPSQPEAPRPPQPERSGREEVLGGWKGMFLTATSLVLTEESRRRLRCSLKLLRLANKHLSEKIDALRRAVDADAQAEGLTPKISADALRQDIVATVRKSVTVITTLMSSALPEGARGLVRNAILALPARWASRADSSGISESAALSLAVEALETIRNVTEIVSSVLDRADAWCEGIGKRPREEIDSDDEETAAALDELNRNEVGAIYNESIPGLVRHLSNESSQSNGADSISTQPDTVLRHTRKASRND